VSTSDQQRRPLRIACYGWAARDGGSGVSGYFLTLEQLLREGHEIDFYAIEGAPDPRADLGSELQRNLTYLEIGATDLRLKWNSRYFTESIGAIIAVTRYAIICRRLRDLARAKNNMSRYDICLFLGRPPDFSIPGVKTIAWVQGPPQTELQQLWKLRGEVAVVRSLWFLIKLLAFRSVKTLLAIRTYRSASTLICGSSWSKNKIAAVTRRPDRIIILPFPVDLNQFAPCTNHRKTKESIDLLWLGRIEPRKRFPLLIAAMERLVKDNQATTLTVVGDWAFTPNYRRFADNLYIHGHITFSPPVERREVVKFLHGCDILVQPSEAENFGSAVAEALSAGVPVVVGSSNGTADYVPSMCGVFEIYDPQEVADTIRAVAKRLRASPTEVQQQCRRTAEANFCSSKVTTDLIAAIHKTIGESALAG